MTWTLPWAILFLLGLLLLLGYFLSKKVFPKEQQEDLKPQGPRGTDCETCGVEGCGGFAKALVRGGREETPVPGGQECKATACSQGQNSPLHGERKAFVCCQGKQAEACYLYSGARSCGAVADMEIRPKHCQQACLGFGDCLPTCPPRAIMLREGIARIDPSRCTGCGDCITSCPLGLIEMIPASGLGIACKSSQGETTQSICPHGCTGCGDCVQACPEKALGQNIGELPILTRERCNGCGHCVDACPQGILSLHKSLHPNAEPIAR